MARNICPHLSLPSVTSSNLELLHEICTKISLYQPKTMAIFSADKHCDLDGLSSPLIVPSSFPVYLLISTEDVLVYRVVFLSVQPPFHLFLSLCLSLQPSLLCRLALCPNVPRHHCGRRENQSYLELQAHPDLKTDWTRSFKERIDDFYVIASNIVQKVSVRGWKD